MTEQDGFDRGSTLHFDRFGNVVDISASLNEHSALLSRMWRLELPYSVLSADGIYGVSPTATLSGSTIKASKLVPGAAQGNVVPGGNSVGSGFFILKPSTTYTLKLLAKGGAANVAANFSVVYLRSSAF